jgi:hypothetical protein
MAIAALREEFPNVDAKAGVLQSVEFVDPGENFECVKCSRCGEEITDWTMQEIDRACEGGFQGLNVRTPCCSLETSLNDLSFIWPAGFARFRIEFWNSNLGQVRPQVVRKVEKALGCQLRQIWDRT